MYRGIVVVSLVARRWSFAFSLSLSLSFHRCAEAVVIPETPLYFNLASLTLGLQGSHLFMDWCVDDYMVHHHPTAHHNHHHHHHHHHVGRIPEDGTTLHVVDRENDNRVSTVTGLDPFFVFHWANAYVEEVEGSRLLHLDACVYDDPDIVEHLLLDTIRRGAGDRWVSLLMMRTHWHTHARTRTRTRTHVALTMMTTTCPPPSHQVGRRAASVEPSAAHAPAARRQR